MYEFEASIMRAWNNHACKLAATSQQKYQQRSRNISRSSAYLHLRQLALLPNT
jgi:hypothetical protein